MRYLELRELADVKLGRQRAPKNHNGDSMRPYVRAANVGWAGLLLDDVKSMNFSDSEMKHFRLQPGDLLLNEGSGSSREVGKPALWSGEIQDCAFQNTLLRVRPGPDIDVRYLLHFFAEQAASGAFSRGSRGVGIRHLGRDALAHWPIPWVNLPEQRRVTKILDLANDVRRRRIELESRSRDLSSSIFEDLFADKLGRTEQLGEHIRSQQIGLDRRASVQGPGREHEYVKMDAIERDGSLNLSALTRVDATPAEFKKYSLAEGDLIFNTRNSRELVGKSAVYRGEPRLYNNNIMRLRFDEQLLPEFVHGFLRSPVGRREVEARKVGTTSVFAIYAGSVAQIPIPIPELSLQVKFAEQTRSRGALADALGRATVLAEEFLASLRVRAFRGEL